MAKAKAPAPRPCTLADLVKAVAALAPTALAEPWDNVGLQVGDPNAPVRRVMTCLEVTPPVLAEARERRADALVAHHPLIFQPLKQIQLSNPAQALVAGLIRADIALVAAHTNLDSACWSTNTELAARLGLEVESRLLPREAERCFKFVVFVPRGHEHGVIEAIAAAGGGRIGNYSHCTFRSPGTGSFLGSAESNPALGAAGRLEQVEEFRLEALVPASAREAVLRAVRAVHPYEEMAHDWLPVEASGAPVGLGVVARPAAAVSLDDLIALCRERLRVGRLRVSGPDRRKIRRVAICTGSGGSFLGTAAARAEAYITGEMNYHQAIEAHARHLPVIELGHFESEVIIASPLAEQLAASEKLAAAAVTVFPAHRDLQPYRHYDR